MNATWLGQATLGIIIIILIFNRIHKYMNVYIITDLSYTVTIVTSNKNILYTRRLVVYRNQR